jgi:ribose transport system permease protein
MTALSAPPSEPKEKSRRVRLPGLQMSKLSGVYLWIVAVIVFSIAAPSTFATADTARSIASQESIVAIVSIGALIPLACGLFDISVAQMLGASAVLCGTLMTKGHMSPALAIFLTLVFGVGVGAINGVLVAGFGVESIVATLGMSSVLLALTEALSKYQFVGPFRSSFDGIANGTVVGIPTVALYAVGVGVIAWYVLDHTPIGRRTYATGSSTDAARLVGIRVKRYEFGSLVAAALLASFAGIVLAAQVSEVGPTVGPPYLLAAFAACFLSRTQIKPGRFNVGGTFVALVLLGTGVEGLQLIGGPLWITDLFNGVALLVAVCGAILSSRWRANRRAGEPAET